MTTDHHDKKDKQDERDDIGTLLRLANGRANVPGERLDRSRAAALATWREVTQRRSRRRYVWTAAAVLAAASVVLAFALRLVPSGADGPTGTEFAVAVERTMGSAWITRPGGASASSRRAVRTGDRVQAGSSVSTEENGRLAVRLASGHSVRLDHSTTLRVIDAGTLALDRGAVYVDSGDDAGHARPVSIRTHLGSVDEIGTQFEVRVGASGLRVRLREGSVVVSGEARVHEVAVGTEFELAADGSTAVREISRYGTEWAWVTGVTPMLDLEGRTAREFLAWVARERGWRLAYADAAVARAANETVVAGTIAGMTLDQALEAVLPSCRLTHHVAEGVLVVDAAPGTLPVGPSAG